jgi:hypothetical protein
MAVSSLIALSFMFPSGAVAQNAVGKVTYVSSGISAGKALKELSPKVGLTLLASPATENDVLVLSLKDAPVKEVLEKLAWAVGGTWKKEGEALRLARTSEDNAAERTRERSHIIEGYRAALAKRKEELAASGELNPAKAEQLAKEAAGHLKNFNPQSLQSGNIGMFFNKMSNESPGGRAMAKLMSLVTAEDLADLPKGIRVVYSTHPTRTQRPLGGTASTIAAAFQRDHTVWMDAMAKHRVANPQIGGTTYELLPGIGAGDENQAEPASRKVGKVLFTMTRSGYFGGGVRMELLLADAKGKVIARGSGGIWPRNLVLLNPTPPPKDDPKVLRGADMEAIASGTTQYGFTKRVPEELRQRLLQPEMHEPLGILQGQTAINAAKVRGTNLVAMVSDANASYGTGAKEIPYTLWLRMQQVSNEIVEEKGWLTLRPFAAASSRENSVDRKTLGQYLRRQAAVGRMKIEEAAMWAAKLPLEEEAQMLRQLATYVRSTGTHPDQYGGDSGSRILRFYGSLSPAQRAAAKQGGLPLSKLEPAQMAMIERMVYGEHPNLNVDHQKAEEMKLDMNDFYSGIRREPTESLPNGIPRDGMLEIAETTSEVAFTSDSEVQGYMLPSQAMGPSEIAWHQFSASRPDLFPWANEPHQKFDFNRLRLGKRTSYTITMKLTPLLSLMNGLEDREYSMTDPVALSALPAAFRKEIETHMDSLRKSYANSQGGATTPATHSTPPPLR